MNNSGKKSGCRDWFLAPTFPPAQLDEFGPISLRMAMAGDQIVLSRTQLMGNVFGVSKIRSDGTYDDSFRPEVSRYGTIKLADIHGGKMLVAGDFIRMNGMETYGIARLSLNGELDESFRLKENKGVVYQLKFLTQTTCSSQLTRTFSNWIPRAMSVQTLRGRRSSFSIR